MWNFPLLMVYLINSLDVTQYLFLKPFRNLILFFGRVKIFGIVAKLYVMLLIVMLLIFLLLVFWE